MPIKISEYLKPELILLSLKSQEKENAIHEMSQHIALHYPHLSAELLASKLIEREKKASTGAEQGVAIPHTVYPRLSETLLCIACSSDGVIFDSIDEKPTQIFFLIIIADKEYTEVKVSYLQIISTICRMVRLSSIKQHILKAQTPKEAIQIIEKEES